MRLLAIYYPTTRAVANVVGRRRVPLMMCEDDDDYDDDDEAAGAGQGMTQCTQEYIGTRMEEEEAGRKFCMR